MSVKKEPSGRRSVQVEVEVPGTPEEVWQAIATGPGISSWFVPAEFEEEGGKPVAVELDFGPAMESRSVVTAWNPPRMFVREGAGWVPGSPPIATEFSVEARAGGVCVVRVVEGVSQSPYGALLRLDKPGPGTAALGTIEFGDSVMATLTFYLYGDQAAGTVARETPLWQAWIQERFPMPTEPSKSD